ncbi:HDOD domain-containing protein [Propionivibrio dicarboxylicus]|uniref:histidine kinase n=1 Tax=Propionivibrio dicarboxylicus TaxID=83767 RepID=A0A1G8K9E3_9RHOO|nr:HDOD domain-containing protein [Propionivibrio dicarboxylicus]SDI40096.1 HDIG domain-containing protein [Propionivibrio dicarboxylicus]
MQQVPTDIRSRLLSARLPAMPQILLKLMERCQNEDTGMSELADLIAKDPGITSKVLGVANSSAFHRSGRALGLESALATLGTDMIRTLVINESVSQVFNSLNQSNGIDLRAFWKHSLTVAVIAKSLAAESGTVSPEEAYLAGLLHDVGRLALLSATDREFAFLFFASDDDRLPDIEHGQLNLNHTEAGAILADRWNLDSFLSDCLLYHHRSAAIDDAHPLVGTIILSHLISQRPDDDELLAGTAAACGVALADIAAIREKSHDKVRDYAEALGIDLNGADDLIVPADGWEIAGQLAQLAEKNAGAHPVAPGATPQSPQESIQQALAEEVRNAMLTKELHQSLVARPKPLAAAMEAIAGSVRILFGIEEIILFRKNANGDALIGTPTTEHRQRLKGFTLRATGASRLSQAARSQQAIIIEHDPDSLDLAESQLMRLLGCDGLISIPVTHTGNPIGILIGGIHRAQVPALRSRERFLHTFGAQAGAALHGSDLVAKETSDTHRSADVATMPRRIVHESNNALSIIKNYLGVLEGKLDKHQIAAKEITVLHEELDRVSHLINADGDESPATDANAIIGNVVRMFVDTRESQAATLVSAEIEEERCEVACPPGALKQILINLVKNAIEAIPEGGDVVLANKGSVHRDGQRYVELSVRDNGPGIPPATLSSLFAPVASGKGGTHQGLGLSIVHDLVKQTGGHISCRSSARGTTFDMIIPAATNVKPEPFAGEIAP